MYGNITFTIQIYYSVPATDLTACQLDLVYRLSLFVQSSFKLCQEADLYWFDKIKGLVMSSPDIVVLSMCGMQPQWRNYGLHFISNHLSIIFFQPPILQDAAELCSVCLTVTIRFTVQWKVWERKILQLIYVSYFFSRPNSVLLLLYIEALSWSWASNK